MPATNSQRKDPRTFEAPVEKVAGAGNAERKEVEKEEEEKEEKVKHRKNNLRAYLFRKGKQNM